VSANTGRPAPPSNDPGWKLVEARMRNFGHESHALIEVLHTIQEVFGYLNEDALTYVASALKIPRSKVYGVATFYHLFSLQPPAQHSCIVCTGTACHIKGADRILNAIHNSMALEPGDTTDDGAVSLQTARCVGFCSPAPIVLYDGEAVPDQNPRTVLEHIERWSKHVT
jgi:bidirectional [NiFe] hydrogenase diaphorase subunit